MKQVHANYTFVASTKTITLLGLNIAQDQLLLITNATRGIIYYNFASSSHRAVVTAGANTTVVLTDASTTGHEDSDQLVIHYDDQVASQTIAGTVTANVENLPLRDWDDVIDSGKIVPVKISQVGEQPVPISGTVTVGNSVTVAGTVTANLASVVTSDTYNLASAVRVMGTGNDGVILAGLDPNAQIANILEGGGVAVIPRESSPNFPISGTVTVSNLDFVAQGQVGQFANKSVQVGFISDPASDYYVAAGESFPFPVNVRSSALPSGAATSANQTTANASLSNIDAKIPSLSSGRIPVDVGNPVSVSGAVTVGNSVTIGSLPAISGTVTANSPNGAVPLTAAQRRGTTSATANTSSTAPSPNDATNPSRKYLLFQNISDTDMYINFGAAATTNDLLVPKNGGGIVFESGFVPTDSVNVICSAASKKYFILSA